MGSNIDREGNRGGPTTSTRRGFGIGAVRLAGGSVIGGEVVRRMMSPAGARAEASLAPSLQELIRLSPVVKEFVGLDETGVERSIRLRVHPDSPLALDASPKRSEDQRQVAANQTASAARTSELTGIDVIITSAEATAGIPMSDIPFPVGEKRISLGYFGTGRTDDVAAMVYAPPTNAASLLASEDLRTEGLYPLLENVFAQTVATGTSGVPEPGAWDSLKREIQGFFMVVPKAQEELNPEGRPLREIVRASPIVDSAGRAIIRSTPDSQYKFTFDLNLKEAFAWWVQAQMDAIGTSGNINTLGIAEPKAIPGLKIGANSVNVDTVLVPSIYRAHEPTQNNPDIVWAPPPKIYFEDNFYMMAFRASLLEGIYSIVTRGLDSNRSFSAQESRQYGEFKKIFGNLLIFAPK